MNSKKKNKINLDELETPKLQKRAMTSYDVNDNDSFLKTADVNLYDFCYKFLVQSSRLCFIIKDDKVEFANNIALRHCEVETLEEIKNTDFLEYVDKKNWNSLSSDITDIITKNKTTKIKMDRTGQKFDFKALYLPSANSFSFILLSEPIEKIKGDKMSLINSFLYDDVTNLPSFLLFEDRLQNAINHEIYKDIEVKKHLVSIVVIDIVDVDEKNNLAMKDIIIKKVAYNLAQGIKKNYTVANGIKHNFWLLLDDLLSKENLEDEIYKIEKILKTPIKHGIDEYYIEYKMAYATFPHEAKSARKLLELAMDNIKKS